MNLADIITLVLLISAIIGALILTKHSGCSSCAKCQNKYCKKWK